MGVGNIHFAPTFFTNEYFKGPEIQISHISTMPKLRSGHRFSLQNKCEFGDTLSVTSFAHLGQTILKVRHLMQLHCIYNRVKFPQVHRCPFSALYSSEIRSSSRMLSSNYAGELCIGHSFYATLFLQHDFRYILFY